MEHDLPLTLTVTDRAAMDHELDAAVSLVRKKALHERTRGILVTRRGSDTFTIDLSETVPFGTTREHQDW